MKTPVDRPYQKNPISGETLGVKYPDGYVIFREGDMCDALYIVHAGNVRIITTLPSGGQIELALVGPGEIFGITTIFENLPRSSTAIVQGGASILKIDRSILIRAIHNDPSLVSNILKSLSQRARKLKKALVESESKHL
ncbi:cyclic nucleotide-binding domain-containing protein [bacterium]|nr:MAG: cyclic nucleotide-binding domain-containing protein [bacterium]